MSGVEQEKGEPKVIRREQIQQALMAEQQRAMVMVDIKLYYYIQEAVRKITSVAFDKCVQKPESSLTSRQATCIAQTTTTYLEARYFFISCS